jgi:hypothetical protein
VALSPNCCFEGTRLLHYIISTLQRYTRRGLLGTHLFVFALARFTLLENRAEKLKSHETTPVRTASAKTNNPEQSLRKAISRKQLLKAAEQKSGFIVEQRQKPLSEQNYDLKSAK